MNLKELIFGEGVHTGGSGGVYRDSVQAWLPIKNIIGGVVITKDNRFVKIMEVLPVNIYLKSAIDRQNIISSFASYLQIAPDELQMIARTLPALAVPLIILGGIYSGFFTPTESAGIACVAAYLIGRFVYKEISLHNLPTILVDSAKQSTVIMFIIACATAFSYFFSYAGLTKSLTQFVLSCHMSPTVFLLFCFVLLVIFGMFMDGTSIAVLLVPLLWPVAKELGIDVIHFGIVFCILNSLGCCTPPVAVNLFGMANISGLSVGEITKGEMPFFIANLCVVLLIIFVPAVTAWVVG